MNAPTPGSAEWARIVTASKVAGILGVSPYDSPLSTWHKMRGDVTDPPRESAAMSRGNYLERGVLAWWTDRHRDDYYDVREQYYAVRDNLPWAAATLDGLAIQRDGTCAVVEVKTTSRMDEWGQPGTDEIPVHYLTQVYWQLAMVPEAHRAYVAVLGPFLDFHEYVVERDETIQADLIERCAAFYESLSGDTPPPLDDHVATYDTLRALHPEIDRGEAVEVDADLAAEYVTACHDEKAATARARAAKAAVLNAAGRAQYVTSAGVRIARRQPGKYGVSLIATAKPADMETAA